MTTTYTPIKKNTASQVIYCSVFSQATGQFQANPTMAAGDFQRSIDGGAFANMDTLPVVTPAAGKVIAITLSAAETNCDRLVIVGSDQAGAEWDDIFIEVQISSQPIETIVNNVWDEILTGATHNIATSAGRRLRQIASSIVIDGTAAAATSNTITLAADASTTDGAYDPSMIYIVNGTGAGQCRLILEYKGSTKTAVVDRNWKVTPSTDSEYVIAGFPGREHVNEGLARAGTTNTITLNALASSNDDVYVGQIVFLRSGTGEDQANRVIDYNGTTKVATVYRNWDVVPDATTAYIMLPTSTLPDNYVGEAIWEYATRTLTQTAASITAAVSGESDLTIYRGDTLSATFTGLTADVSDNDKLWFTFKTDKSGADTAALVMIDKTGLTRINGEAATTAANGAITTPSTTSVTVTLAAVEAAKLGEVAGYYDIQKLKGTTVTTLASGDCTVTTDVTRATS